MFASRARTVMSLVEESPRWSNPLDSNRGHLILPQARPPAAPPPPAAQAGDQQAVWAGQAGWIYDRTTEPVF